MPDDTHDLQATIQAAARDILAGFDREQIPTNNAIAIVGLVLTDLLKRVDPEFRRILLAALKAEANA